MSRVLTIILLWFLGSSPSLLYSVCASTFSHVSFSLTYRDAESSPLRSADADPADLPEDMPMRAFVAAGTALRARLNMKRKLMDENPLVRSLSYGGAAVGDFFLTIPVGTPSQNIIFLVDTGSEFTWTQCSPCLNCTKTRAPGFNYKHSSSFDAVGNDSLLCCDSVGLMQFPTSDYKTGGSPLCLFILSYGDGSLDAGFSSIDLFHLGPHLSKRFVFGCANFVFDTAPEPSSGLMGLDGGPFSFTSRLFSANPSMPKKFAYCLPDRMKSLNAEGRIELGNYTRPAKVRYTPLAPPYGPLGSVYYYVELQGIKVGERLIKVDMGGEEERQGRGTIFDSGTALTYLVRPVYNKLVWEMRRQTAHLRPFNASKSGVGLDLCYKVAAKAKEPPKVPRISLHFAKGVELKLEPQSILFAGGRIRGDNSSIYFCMAFQGAPDVLPMNIIGNYQQQNYWVEYNLETASLGLAKTKCA